MKSAISDDELRFLAQYDWARVNAAPLAKELLELRSELLRLKLLLNEARSEREALENSLASLMRSSGV
jgi:hypothetical protein